MAKTEIVNIDHPRRAYHFVGSTLRDGREIPADGEWLVQPGEIVMCASGLHASLHPFDALNYAPGNTLCLVELAGTIIHGDDKVVAKKRRIVARIDSEKLCREFARDCARSVLHLWDAPEVVKEYSQFVGDGKHLNYYFVTDRGHVVMIADDAEAAYYRWLAIAQSTPLHECALEDRLTGVIASVEPISETDDTLCVQDDYRFWSQSNDTE